MGQPYELVSYQRHAKTHLAPDSLKNIHPLGKSPVIELDGQVIAESGAITQVLIERFGADRLRPAIDAKDYASYLQWMDFSESSLMVPLLLELFTRSAGVTDNDFLNNYIAKEKHNLLSYLDNELEGKTYIVGDQLTGADFMLSFDLIMLNQRGLLDNYPNIKSYAQNLAKIDSYRRALALEAKHDNSK
ncbi:glutathione S-transferase family protein [Moraxella canis]|uniref:glutathione S-transferase family protein n=1 Tax=Moraxella canis TaxID=90239 RepID=UPI000991B7C4|nr:glutathione S-transferase [Moraxella canis]